MRRTEERDDNRIRRCEIFEVVILGLGLGDPDAVHRSDDAPPENYSGLATNVALYAVNWYILYGILDDGQFGLRTDDRADHHKEEEDRNMTSGSSSSNHMNICIISKSLKFI